MSFETRLFVGNLPDNTIDKELHSAFSSFGEVTNLDIKNKPDVEQDKKIFAFITLSASNYDIESCIQHFCNQDFNGNKLYVTRARESFLERLQRERAQLQKQEEEAKTCLEKNAKTPKKVHLNLGHLNPKKRKTEKNQSHDVPNNKVPDILKKIKSPEKSILEINGDTIEYTQIDQKKKDSDLKRMESMKKKRQEFKEKKNIIKTGLVAIDKVHNKKIKFSDDEPVQSKPYILSNGLNAEHKKRGILFDDEEDSENDVNFEVKKQFEGKQGQKVLELQSRYKSDKRFVLDERFIEDNPIGEEEENQVDNEESIELATQDEKTEQLNILQDVLGVTIKSHSDSVNSKKTKAKLGMLRFDPSQPEHAKLLAPIDETQQEPKKKKKKLKEKQREEEASRLTETLPVEEKKFPVSKEQFYKVSETLKEAIAQPNSFSLRSLFGQTDEDAIKDDMEQDTGYIPLEAKKPSKKNPLDLASKNPFMYDSSESENEKEEKEEQPKPEKQETRAVWKENLFFTESDVRFSEALAFFNCTDNRDHKERRELKSLMKKRIYNKDRKNQMFQKKIGGRKKSFKKSYRKK